MQSFLSLEKKLAPQLPLWVVSNEPFHKDDPWKRRPHLEEERKYIILATESKRLMRCTHHALDKWLRMPRVSFPVAEVIAALRSCDAPDIDL